MNLDQLIKNLRDTQPSPAEMQEAAARVRERLFPSPASAGAAPAQHVIRSCADFSALTPAYLAGSLDAGRKLLFEVHTRECVACRKALENTRTGGPRVIEFAPRHAARRNYAGWAIAASALLAVGAATWWGFEQYPAIGGGPRAVVDSVDGALYKVAGASLIPLAPGAELAENDAVRTTRNSTAVLHLNDGSRIELNQRAQMYVTRDWSGSTIHLGLGSIIVQAAKQRRGTLQVATADCNVSVKGTIFSVDAGATGSRVAVVEGTVWVDRGQKHDVLHRGDQTATAPAMGNVPMREEFEWSRNSAQYLALLGELKELKQEIAALPAPGLRYESNLLAYLPADTAIVAAIPNIGGTLSQANMIFRDRLAQSATLAAWWNQRPEAQRRLFENTIAQLATASSYLGNEIVVAAGKNAQPVILGQMVKPGFEEKVKPLLPPAVHARFDNNLFIAAGSAADLDRIAPSGAFLHSALYQHIAPAYKKGAGWLFATNLGGTSGMRYVVAESRNVDGNTENHATVGISQTWLTAPGPMGSLDFVSPDASFAAAMLLKDPSKIDVGQAFLPARLFPPDMTSALGGEVTVAIDGPMLPVPSWKIAAEVYNPERLQEAIAKLVTTANAQPNDRTGELKLTQSEGDGRAYYRLQAEKLPWEADWTFVDGYWLVAANRELLVRSIQNRQVGYTLAKSDTFRSHLTHDGSPDFSAVVYHNLGPSLGSLFPQFEGPAGVVGFWAARDSIDVATMGNIFSMNIESLLAMQGQGPVEMLMGAMNAPTHKATR